MPAVIRRLGVHENSGTTDLLAQAQAQHGAAQASIARLDDLVAHEPEDSSTRHVAEKLRRLTQLRANGVWEQLGRPESETGEAPGTVYRRMRREMLNAERDVFVARRDAGEIDDEILRRVLRELDFEEATLDRDGG